MQNKPIVIGLTGNIGAGKNTVAAMLSAHGAAIIDADETSHRIMRQGHAAYEEVLETFGHAFVQADGELDRQKLGAFVFQDADRLNKLVEITHKHILADNLATMERLQAENNVPYIVLNAPLLVESGMDAHADKVWVVFADEEKRVERVVQRDHIDAQMVRARIQHQTNPFTLLQHADEIIENNGDLDAVRAKVDALLTQAEYAR